LDLTITQRYRNDTTDNLEIVYTFPLPEEAELLSAVITIGDQTFAAKVKEKEAAAAEYEESILDGSFAALTEKASDGLYTVNLGNVLPQEAVTVAFRFGQILAYNGDLVRLTLPTVIAPLYGDPVQDGGLAPHAAPMVDTLAAYPFTLSLELIGEVAQAKITSPSHAITVSPSPNGRTVTLGLGAFLDRDLVLNLTNLTSRSYALTASSGEETVVLAGFSPLIAESDHPLAIKLLVDLSGSMNGQSIQMARTALLTVLKLLRPQDYLTLSVFGSSVIHLVPDMRPLTEENVAKFKSLTRKLEANMGGTEMTGALTAVLEGLKSAPNLIDPPVVLMITDGEVWEVDAALKISQRLGQRIFTLALGCAPREVLFKGLSKKTAGATEYIAAPKEVKPAVERLWRKMKTPSALEAQINWETSPLWVTPLESALYDGVTVTVAAGFKKPVMSPPTLSWKREGVISEVAPTNLVISSDPNLTRLATGLRLKTITDPKLVTKLALENQLVTEETSLIMVHERAEKATSLPVLKVTPQMMTAYYGGFGGFDQSMGDLSVCPENIVSHCVSLSRLASAPSLTAKKCYSFSDASIDLMPLTITPGDYLQGFTDLMNSPEKLAEAINQVLEAKTLEDFTAYKEKVRRLSLEPLTSIVNALKLSLSLTDDEAWGFIIVWLTARFPERVASSSLASKLRLSLTKTISSGVKRKFRQSLN
jgi:Ca-activated chloride channel family protein